MPHEDVIAHQLGAR